MNHPYIFSILILSASLFLIPNPGSAWIARRAPQAQPAAKPILAAHKTAGWGATLTAILEKPGFMQPDEPILNPSLRHFRTQAGQTQLAAFDQAEDVERLRENPAFPLIRALKSKGWTLDKIAAMNSPGNPALWKGMKAAAGKAEREAGIKLAGLLRLEETHTAPAERSRLLSSLLSYKPLLLPYLDPDETRALHSLEQELRSPELEGAESLVETIAERVDGFNFTDGGIWLHDESPEILYPSIEAASEERVARAENAYTLPAGLLSLARFQRALADADPTPLVAGELHGAIDGDRSQGQSADLFELRKLKNIRAEVDRRARGLIQLWEIELAKMPFDLAGFAELILAPIIHAGRREEVPLQESEATAAEFNALLRRPSNAPTDPLKFPRLTTLLAQLSAALAKNVREDGNPNERSRLTQLMDALKASLAQHPSA